ncbi:unnamed protein product [Caenorhabditis brenneri]
MRWFSLGASQVRSFSSMPPDRDFSRIISLAAFWKKYQFRHELLAKDQPVVNISRDGRKCDIYGRIGVKKGCPRVILLPNGGFIEHTKAFVKGYLRNAFVRGSGLQAVKSEFLEEVGSVFDAVLKAIREEDFSPLTEFTLGGNETLQFHRSAAHKLSKIQKEALNITSKDFLGDNGFIIKYPYFRNELSPYIHSIDLTNVDAVGNTHPIPGENQEDKEFCRYKVVLGGIYKYESLNKEIQKESGMWNERIRTPKDYIFRFPRYTFVELDICQQAYGSGPIKLDRNRSLYDFHVFSF